MHPFTLYRGFPLPYGVSSSNEGTNFALFAKHATHVTLCLFDVITRELRYTIPLDAVQNKTGDIWHVLLAGLPRDLLYAYKIDGPQTPAFIYDTENNLLDPYAHEVATGHSWAPTPQGYHPLGRVDPPLSFDWQNVQPPRLPLQDLIIYEMHVRAFTQHPSSGVQHPGTFLGIIEKIPYLLDLGINAVELLPIHEFNQNEVKLIHPTTYQRLQNFWGYSTVNFFAPMNRYASTDEPGAALVEFKTLVRELHRNGIEVILDVVFNHTAEGNAEGPVLSFKGIDNPTYYILEKDDTYSNYTGCGNTFNGNYTVNIELILKCLRYWVLETHVDGFRFDLASCLKRGKKGDTLDPSPLIEAISDDPLLSHVKLIAEPWDAVGFYEVGSFYTEEFRWSEWNGKFRDTVRQFIRGTPGCKGIFITRLFGSQDLYYNRSPLASVNFITAHDGFTLNDLVSYNHKHNEDNGEHNRDGVSQNDSWNCGEEGPTTSPTIIALRQQQMRNLYLALMVSTGIPMVFMGDEYGHTKNGNNNTWCHDKDLNWFLWDRLTTNAAFHRFCKLMIHFRQSHPLLKRDQFLQPEDALWHGAETLKPNWDPHNQFIAVTLIDVHQNEDIYFAFNAQPSSLQVTLPHPPPDKTWHLIADTAAAPPHDAFAKHEAPAIEKLEHDFVGFSAVLLVAMQ